MNEYSVVMVFVSSILTLQLNINIKIMIIKLFKGKYVVELKFFKLIIHIPHTTTNIQTKYD